MKELASSSDGVDSIIVLNRGQTIYSNNQAYKLILQLDGNLVIYRCFDNTPIWATETNGKNSINVGYQVTLENDGRICVWNFMKQCIWISQPVEFYLQTSFSLKFSDNGQLLVIGQNEMNEEFELWNNQK